MSINSTVFINLVTVRNALLLSIFALNACLCLCVNLFALLFSDSVCTHPNPWRSCFTAEELLGVLFQSLSICPKEGEKGPIWAPVCKCRWLKCHQKVDTGGICFRRMVRRTHHAQSLSQVLQCHAAEMRAGERVRHRSIFPPSPGTWLSLCDTRTGFWRTELVAILRHLPSQNSQTPHTWHVITLI